MADNDNKAESNKKLSPLDFSSVFTKNQDKGAPAEAEAPTVVDSQKQEATLSRHQKPASWTNSDKEAGATVADQDQSELEPKLVNPATEQVVSNQVDSELVVGAGSKMVTEDNKLSMQHEEQVKDFIVEGSEYWKNTTGATKEIGDVTKSSPLQEPTVETEEEPKLCTEVKFNLPASAFSLVSFFPDSHYAVILKNGHYYTANLGTEVIEPTPYTNYETLLLAEGLVVLVVTELNNSETLLFLTNRFEGKKFRKPSEAKLESLVEECMADGSYQFTLANQTFSLLSNSTHKEVDARTGYFAYPSGTFIYNTNGYLVFEEPNGTELLLADAHGCYVGFYLPLVHEVEEIKILLGPDVFINPRRLTQTLMVVTNEETNQQSILTCSRPMLVELADLGIKDASQIEVSNGVAMITQEVKGSTCINVFTPKHQRIIIDRGIKIDTLAIGNGVYLPTEGVMLLDDGRLIFARGEEDGSVFIRGKRVDLPQQFLEIN